MRRTITFTAALFVSALALVGCSAPASDSAEYSDRDSGVTAPQVAPEAAEGGSEAPVAQDAIDRQVVTTGWVTITVDEPMDAAADAVRIVEGSGGRIDGRSEYAPIDGDKGSATLTLRIPADSLTATLDRLRDLGDVQEVSLNASDVTMQTQDLDARITALDASIERLLTLMAGATDTEALISLETAISDRQAELESLKAQQRYLADQVSMSTITLSLVSVADAPVQEPDTFVSGLIAGWNAFVAFFAGLLVALGVLLPWLIFAGIVTLVVVVLVRRSQKRKVVAPAE
jgi:hypothetical protein